jgi:hypothetical protein
VSDIDWPLAISLGVVFVGSALALLQVEGAAVEPHRACRAPYVGRRGRA